MYTTYLRVKEGRGLEWSLLPEMRFMELMEMESTRRVKEVKKC